MAHILIIDDEPGICWALREYLTDGGHTVTVTASAEDGLAACDPASAEAITPDAVLLDVRLPGMDGLTAIEHLQARLGSTPLLVMTAFGNLETAVRAVQSGAFEYLTKPFDLEQAGAVLDRALASGRLAAAVEEEPAEQNPAVSGDDLAGHSPPMQAVFRQIAMVAATDVPVLVTGESGTGKEVAARAIHRHSHRAAGPFVAVSLPALNPGLVESELFGHVRGAFTGADTDRPGVFELADGGTVLLDELGDAPLSVQVKLLRALEQKEITRVGDLRPRPVNVRVIAATHRSLPAMIDSGDFRQDLYFRLSVFHIALPPLRRRRDDIPLLARRFLEQIHPEAGAGALSEPVLEELRRRDWSGNVRELRNAVERAAVLARGNPLAVEHLPPPLDDNPPTGADLDDSDDSSVTQLERQTRRWFEQMARTTAVNGEEASLYSRYLAVTEPALLQTALDHCEGNRLATAALLGMHRTTLRQKLRRYGLDS